jgi:hypothetical protein
MMLHNVRLLAVSSILMAQSLGAGAIAASPGGQDPTPPPCSAPAALARFDPVVSALGASGIRVLQICRSHLDGTFVSPNVVGFVQTDIGSFELVVFDDEAALEDLRVTSSARIERGQTWYWTMLSGIGTTPSPFDVQGSQRVLFLMYRSYLVIAYDSAVEQRVGQALGAAESPCPRAVPSSRMAL